MTSTSTDRRDGFNTSAAIKVACRIATTANITLSGYQTIDGVLPTSSDSEVQRRILVKNQTTATGNGVYIMDTGTWARAKDFDGTRDSTTGTLVPVNFGTNNQKTVWRLTTTGTIVFGTSSITFEPAALFTGSEVISVASIAALKALTGITDGQVVEVTSYYASAIPDGGGGRFKFDSTSTATDNGGKIIAPDAGGVGRWRALGDMSSALRWGAKGDGVNDDSTAIQAAIDAFNTAGGGDVFLPEGTFLISTSLVIKNFVKVYGAGLPYLVGSSTSTQAATIIKMTAASTAIKFGDGSTFGTKGSSLEDLEVYGAGTATNGVVFYGTAGSSASANTVRRVRANNFTGNGFEATQYAYVNTFDHTEAANCAVGYYLKQEANAWTFVSPKAHSNGVNYRVGSGSGTSQNDIVLIDPHSEGAASEGILVDNPTNSLTIVGGYAESNAKEAIKTQGTALTLVIKGGRIVGESNSYDGINISAGAIIDISGIAFGGNTKYDINLPAAATVNGQIGHCRHGATAVSGRIATAFAGSRVLINDTGGTFSLGAGQIQFPATQNASSGANTLDDYEEGAWTPALTFATPGDLAVTYSAQVGNYTKIGKMVHVHFVVSTSAFTHTTASGSLRITGLPFTVASGQDHFGGGAWGGITKANYTQITPAFGQNSTLLTFLASGSAVAISQVDAANVPTGGTVSLRFTGAYIASA